MKVCVNVRWRGEDLVCEAAGRVDGGWSDWEDYGFCSVTCGDGEKTQVRHCNNPSPAHGGAECTLEDGTTGLIEHRTVPCNLGPCPIDGGWSDWVDDGFCSVTCGDGEKTQVRHCNNPSPAHGGAECTLEDGTAGRIEHQTVSCNDGPCPIGRDDCSQVICQNGGTCVDVDNTYSCDCDLGYEGDHCETNTDDCDGVTCQTGGTCVDGISTYSCDCDLGYEGDHCETNTDDCDGVTCQNGGTCVDGVNTYSCNCDPGYEGDHCETAQCLLSPLYGQSADEEYSRSSCVNYDVLLPEVTKLTTSFPTSLVEVGLSNVLTDLEELRDLGLIPFEGSVGPLGNGARRRRSPPHWSRVGNVISLVYDSLSGAEERLVAFAADSLAGLGENDDLEGPLRSLTEDVEGFPTNYPETTAEAMPSLVQDFHDLLNSFNCNNGPNCELTRGQDDVIELDDHWSIVYRPALEYDPGSMKRAVRFRILVVAWRGFRVFIRCFIY
ncbi:uncharacterized protein LOC144907570 [Branchiostoma floridae x Branchiostoma belcheri]